MNAPTEMTAVSPPPMTLEAQLESLSELGLSLNDGVTIDDLLY